MALQNSSTSRLSLDELAIKHGTDKSSLHHNYAVVYERLLDQCRDDSINVLELGWGGHEDPNLGGASALMWREYFPNATVVCLDIEEKKVDDRFNGIEFRRGSQSDPLFISEIAKEFGPFDLIVDDASHLSSLTIKSWELLYPHLRGGGIYIVEDTHSSYHAWYYGREEANPNPNRPTSSGRPTAVQYFKRAADEVNNGLFHQQFSLGFDLDMVSFRRDLVIIQKASNKND